MAKQELKIELTIEYDPAKNNDKPANIFLYQFLTRLNREWPILEITYKGIKKIFRTQSSNINNIALSKVNSIDDNDLPEPPEWLDDMTTMEPRTPKKKPPTYLKDRTILPPRKTKK